MSVFRNLQAVLTQTASINYKKIHLQPRCVNATLIRLLSYVPSVYGEDRNPAPLFFDREIRKLLKNLTRIDLNKVYRKRQLGDDRGLAQPIYKFMTDEQLEETIRKTKSRVKFLLQMPPVVPVRKPIDNVLVKDPALQGVDESKYIFTDVTFGKKDCERVVVIRELDGTLREADWETRDRINQLYFPKVCRTLKAPRMFEDHYLQSLLERKEYIFILDRACSQYEPDHPDYQRVTSLTYQHVNDNNAFEALRSTRHFGPFAFYLVWFKNVDNLMLDLIETAHIEEANNLLQLYDKINNSGLSIDDVNSLDGVVKYIKEFAQKKGQLELAVQAYKDLERQRNELNEGIKAAHGLA